MAHRKTTVAEWMTTRHFPTGHKARGFTTDSYFRTRDDADAYVELQRKAGFTRIDVKKGVYPCVVLSSGTLLPLA